MIDGKRNNQRQILNGNAMQIHLPIYIVALAISMTILDSLIPINTKVLIGIATLHCISSTNRSAYGGFLGAASGIRGAEREPFAQLC
jgi:hypothetical protein